MKKERWKVYAFYVALSELAGLLAGLLSRKAVQLYEQTALKPALSPPGWLFPVVWTLLYLLMGVGAARIALTAEGANRTNALRVFYAQLAVNFVWPLLFFNASAYGAAFICLVVLWGLIVWMTLSFRELDGPAALMQLPYLLWVAFAGYLNLGAWLLNH